MQEKIRKILSLFDNKKFISYNIGTNSTDRRNIKSVCECLEALHKLSNRNLKEGSLFFECLKFSVIDYMKESGFKYHVNSKNQIKFKKVE